MNKFIVHKTLYAPYELLYPLISSAPSQSGSHIFSVERLGYSGLFKMHWNLIYVQM